jgi:hypothetical protein
VLEGRTVPSLTVMATAGTPQSAVVNTAFATPLKVVVEDSGNPVGAGVNVTFDAPTLLPNPGGEFPGQALTVTVATDGSGTATAPTFTANTITGQFTVTASVTGGTSASFDLTNLPGPAAILTANNPRQFATVGTAFTNPLVVYVTDAFHNHVEAGVNVTFTAPGSGASGTFPGAVKSVTVPTQLINGVQPDAAATAPTFTANGTAGSYVVTASVAGGATAVFNMQNVSPDAVIDGLATGLPAPPPAVTTYTQADLSSAGGVGSVSYDDGNSNFPSVLTGLTSFTYNGHGSGTNYLSITLPSNGPLLSGPVRFNVLAGSGALILNRVNATAVTQPGAVVEDGQVVLYSSAGMQLQFGGVSGINASAVSLYPAPEGAFVKYYSHWSPVYMSPQEHFVQCLYLDVLGRAGSLAEVDAWANQLYAANPPRELWRPALKSPSRHAIGC